jgi:hypothetical protein
LANRHPEELVEHDAVQPLEKPLVRASDQPAKKSTVDE